MTGEDETGTAQGGPGQTPPRRFGANGEEGASGFDGSRRLHPATLIVRWIKLVPQMLGGGAAYGFATARDAPGRFALFMLAALAIGAGAAVLAWWRFRYTIGEDEIVIESGVVRRQRRVIPYDRIQDVAIEQRLLARLFGTARARIETGSAGADEGDLDMIGIEEARALRDRVRGRASIPFAPRRNGQAEGPAAGREAAAAAPAPRPEDEPVLFRFGFGRLLFSGLFDFSLLFLAALYAVLQNLDQFGLINFSEWLSPKRTQAAAGYFNLHFALILVPLVVALGLVSGVARTVSRDFGFRLSRSPGGLRRRRGLTTLSEVVIPLRRTQVAVIESGAIGRQLGWHRLSFETLGADRKEGGVQVAAPFARMNEILPILAEAGFPAPPGADAFQRAPARALLRATALYLAAALPLVGVAFVLEPWAGLGAAAMALLALAAGLGWRKRGYAVGEEALFVRRGLLTRRLSIIPFERTQTIRVWRGPLQRRLGLASLLVDTAGAPLVGSPDIVDMERAAAESLAVRLLALFHAGRRRQAPAH